MKGSMNSMVSPTAPPQPAIAKASDFIATSVNASASTHTPTNVATRMTRRSRGISIAHLPQSPRELIDDMIHGVARRFFPVARWSRHGARALDEIFELLRQRRHIARQYFAGLQFTHEPRRVSLRNHGKDGTARGQVPVQLAGNAAFPTLLVREQHEQGARVFHGGDARLVRNKTAVFDVR